MENLGEIQLKLYTHYVLRNRKIVDIDKREIENGEPILWIGTTPTTPVNFEFIFGIFDNGTIVNEEYLYDLGYFDRGNSERKLKDL